jgi:ribosomal protein S27E
VGDFLTVRAQEIAKMDTPEAQNLHREFLCVHCSGKIRITWDLPPTTAACPMCGGEITSPAAENVPTEPELAPAVVLPVAPVALPTRKIVPAAMVIRNPEPLPKNIAPNALPRIEENLPPLAPVVAEASAWKLIVGLAALVLALLGIAAGAYFYPLKTSPKATAAGNESAPPASSVREENYIRVGWQKEAKQLLKTFIAAPNCDAKLPLILNAEGLASKINDFYGGAAINDNDTPADAFSTASSELAADDRKRGLFMMTYDQPPQFEMKEFFRPLASLEVQYGIDEADLLLSTVSRVGNFAMEPLRVQAFFKRTPEGLKLDWELFVQTKYRTFLNFVELPELNQVGIFRVCIAEDVPDKGRTIAGTRSYRLLDPANTADAARLNVKIDSDIGRTLSTLNWRGIENAKPQLRTATVELKWLENDQAPELVISRFICWEFLGLGGQASPATALAK